MRWKDIERKKVGQIDKLIDRKIEREQETWKKSDNVCVRKRDMEIIWIVYQARLLLLLSFFLKCKYFYRLWYENIYLIF